MAWCQRWFTYFSPSRLCVHSRAGRCLVTNKNQRLFIELDNSLCQTRRIIARLNLWWESAKQETSLVLWVIISSEKQTSSSVFTLRPGELDFCVSFWLLKWVCDTDTATVKCWNDNQQGTGHRWTVCGSALIFFFICLNTANINTKKIHTFVFISVYLAPAPFFRCCSHIKEDFYWLYLVLLPGRRLPLIMSVTLSWEWSAVHLPSVFPPSSGLCLIKTEFKLESNGTVLWLCQLWCYCHCKFGNAL